MIIMNKGLLDFIVHGRSFKKEFKRQLKTFIIVSAGFTIAFTWRETIFDISQSIVQFFTHIKNSSTLSITTSVLTTMITILVVFLTIYFLRERQEDY